MLTVMDLLIANRAICMECLTQQTDARSDTVFRELNRLGLVPQEDRCVVCAEVQPVFIAAGR